MASREAIVHALVFTVFASALYHNIANIFINGVTNSYGGRFKFLTFINLLVSVLYYGLAVLSDVLIFLGLVKRNKEAISDRLPITKCRDFIFGSLIFPLSFIVTCAFWGVMAVDSELMLPSNLRPMIPIHGFYNHAAHSAPLLLAFLEMYFVQHPHYPSRASGSFFFTVFCVAYLSWIMWIAHFANIWVYPVLKVLTWSGRAVFLGSAYLFGLCSFFLGFAINARKKKFTSKKNE